MHRSTVLLRVSTVVAFCAALIGGGAVGTLAEITASYRLVCTGEPPRRYAHMGT